MITSLSQTGVTLIEYYECGGKPDDPKWLKAYLDSGNVPTIGCGSIQYPNGQRVKMGDTITRQQMKDYFLWESNGKSARVNAMTRDDVNQPQFDSLVSICYNIGTNALQKSSLIKVVNADLKDLKIVDRFCDWKFDNGKFVAGLLKRRMSEAFYFFTGKLFYDWVNYRNVGVSAPNEVKARIKATITL